MGFPEVVPQADYGTVQGSGCRSGSDVLVDAEKAMDLIQQLMGSYTARIETEGTIAPESSSILFCLQSAMKELKGDSPLVSAEAHREAIAWLELALDFGA